MNIESIKKLILSKDSTNIELAMNLLVGKTKAEIMDMFGTSHKNAHTLIKGVKIDIRRDRWSYQISEDCIIYVGYNMSITDNKHYNHKDLTI